MQSTAAHNFAQVPSAEIPRSSFDRSCGYKTTFDAGYLIPVFLDEALPGDTFNCKMHAFARLATPITPIMDNIFLDSFFFAVPIRLIWDNWQRFNGEQTNPDDSTDYVVPTLTSPAVTGWTANSLSDYFGLPTEIPDLTHMSLFHRAYNLIWNEWFRDQNLQDSVVVDRDDGPDTPTDYVLLRRGKRHDYFTSCLPWPQKGPSVSIPLTGNAPVLGLGIRAGEAASGTDYTMWQADGSSPVYSDHWAISNGQLGVLAQSAAVPGPGNLPQIFADLSDVAAATINQLRNAFQIQKLYERDARGGTRYTEIIRAHFGVISPDARLQRPEYLGGGSTPVLVKPIPQTSSTDATTPQGNLAAMGTASVHGHGFSKSFTEHSIIIGMVSARADLSYQQGLNRMFSRSTRWDFYWPALSHIGEQAVLNKEIYAQGSAAPTVDSAAFGYQERFGEYRYKPSLITGEFRSNFAQSLDVWHLAQNFSSLPVLGEEFIEENPPIDRIIAVPSEPHFLFDSYFKLTCARPMPVYGVPGLIDHF